MSPHRYCKPNDAGFSLIEILVGMVMGLISMVIVMQVFATFEGQKRTTSSGSDAQTNGGAALYSIERDIRMAGYGFADALGCTVNTAQNTLINRSSAGSSFILAPVTITQGAGGLPDTISVMASNKQNWTVPLRNATDHSLDTTHFNVSSTIGMTQNDLLIAYETNDADALIKSCTLTQVSSTNPVVNPVATATGYVAAGSTGSWNDPGILPTSDYTVNALLIDVGSLMVTYYLLDANNNLLTRQYDSAINANDSDQILSSDVVNLQAQYGFDTRSAAAIWDPITSTGACPPTTASGQCSIVDTWSDTMLDADGSGVTGDAGDIGRIYAIRFAVVARSGQKEKPDPLTGVCNTTTTSPSWAGGTIDVSKNPDGSYPKKDDGVTSDPNAWKCYRYKTFETIVALRNAIWKQR